jgi:hypothetical protein
MTGARRRSGALLLAACLAGCGSSELPPAAGVCTPGAVSKCACRSGAASTQICSAAGQLGACACGAEGPAPDAAAPPGADGGTPAFADAAPLFPDVGPDRLPAFEVSPIDSPPPPTGCAAVGMVQAGKDRLIDVFTTGDGIIVVSADGITLRGRDRSMKAMVKATRPITTASFDGTYLAIADAAQLNVYTPGLQAQGSVLLTEPCAASVLMDNGVFVCGPSNDWDRVFYTYSARDRVRLAAASKKYTYNGIPMRRVPGSNHFITVTTSSSPSDFHLYRVEPSGDVVFINESPYHGAFPATMTFGYNGLPVTHLVNVDGLLLKIFGDGCTSTMNSFNTGCFVKDGNLGTLWTGESFLTLANDGQGKLYGVVGTGGPYYSSDPPCKKGCAVQQIDVEKRKVVTQRSHVLDAKRILVSQPDPSCKMIAVGYEVTGTSSSYDWSGYQVDLLDYGAE